MAEYVSPATSSTRRTSIIREARFPKKSIVAQYERARSGLTAFLCDGTRSFQHFADATEYLRKREGKVDATVWSKRDSRSSIEAIDSFQRHYNKLTLRKLDCRVVHGRQPLLDMWPTKISVAIDCTVHKPTREGPDKVGAAILLFSRGESSSKARSERSKTIAGLIYTHASRHLGSLGEPDPELCFAVDVFGGVAYNPPGTFARKLRNVEDACVEIADRWPKISPPADYDGPDLS